MDTIFQGIADFAVGMGNILTLGVQPAAVALGDSTGGQVAAGAGNAETAVSSAVSSALPSGMSITVWLVLIVIAVLGIAYVTREVAG